MTEGIHRAVDLAREAARGYSSTQVDTEHLLLGLLQERKRKRNFVAWCLDEFGVTLDKVREHIESVWMPDAAVAEEVEFAFTPRLRNAVEQAQREARQLGDNYLGTEHILLGILEEPEGGAAQILSNLGVDRVQARQTVMRMLGVSTLKSPHLVTSGLTSRSIRSPASILAVSRS